MNMMILQEYAWTCLYSDQSLDHTANLYYIIWKGSSDTYYIILSFKWPFESASPNIGASAPGGFPRGFSGFVLVFIWSMFLDVLRAAGQPSNMVVGVDATWCKIRGAKQRGLWSWRQIYVQMYICRILRLYLGSKVNVNNYRGSAFAPHLCTSPI